MIQFGKLLSLFIVCNLALQNSVVLAQGEQQDNQTFLENCIIESIQGLLDTLETTDGGDILLAVTASNSREPASRFLEDILLQRLVQAGYQVFLNRNQSSASFDSLMDARDILSLELVLDKWLLSASRRENNKTGGIEQVFRMQLRYRLIAEGTRVLSANNIAGQKIRNFRDIDAFRAAQAGQPAFAQADAPIDLEKNSLINTIIISGITGLTVFLIYSLRSQ